MAAMRLDDSTRLKLHPLRIAPFGDDTFSVMRRGGRKEVATRAPGVEAVNRLMAGSSIGETRRWLAERHGADPDRIRIEPLLQVLMDAGMVAEVDGVSVGGPQPSVRDRLRFELRFDVLPRVARTVKVLPLPIARPLLREVYHRKLKLPCAGKVSRAGASFERVYPGAGARERRAFEKQFFDHLVRNVVDLEALRQRPFREVDEWLETFVRLEGMEVLDWARRQGRGVMLVGFHFPANRLLPVALMRRGCSLTSMGAINVDWGPERTKRLIAEWRKSRPSYGALELVDNLDLGSVNRLVRELRRGGVVLTMPDVFSISTAEDPAVAERSEFFGVVRSRFRRAVVPVRFFDHWIDVNPWGGWLASKAQPLVLPVVTTRRKRCLICRFGEPFAGDGGEEAVNRELFARLEREVAAHPAQWFGWHNLDRLNPRPRGEAREDHGELKGPWRPFSQYPIGGR